MGVVTMNDLLGAATDEIRGDLSMWGISREAVENLRIAVVSKNKLVRRKVEAATLAGNFSPGLLQDASDALARARRQAVVSARLEATDSALKKGSGLERGPPKHVGDRSSCGTVQGGYWGHSAGLLWDAKLCASEFACVRPKYFPHFTDDLKAAVHARTGATAAVASPASPSVAVAAASAEATSGSSTLSGSNGWLAQTDNGTKSNVDPAGELATALATRAALDAEHTGGRRSVLCYMSRGEGVRRGGMENETDMRNFVTAHGRKDPFQAAAIAAGNAAAKSRRLTPGTNSAGVSTKQTTARHKFVRGPPATSNSTDHGCSDGVVLDFTEGELYFQDFAAQAAAVAQCDVLLGPHGAGMMHLVWMTRPSATVNTKSHSRSSSGSSHDNDQRNEPPLPPLPRETFTGAVVELLGLSHEGRVMHMYYYEHLAALAGLEYVIVSCGDPSTYVPVVNEFEDMGLGQLPDFKILAEALRPLCAAADGSGPPLQVPPPGAKFGKEVAATVWHDLW
jgi:hypothetical protein